MEKFNISNIPGKYEIYNNKVSLELLLNHDESMYLNIHIECACWKIKIQKIGTSFKVHGGPYREQTYHNIDEAIKNITMFIGMLATKEEKEMFGFFIKRVITELRGV